MPRRKQDCPKRMKWEGGEEGPEEEGDKLDGEDEGSLTSGASPAPPDDDAASPTPGDPPTPPSPRSLAEDQRPSSRDSCPSGESMVSERPVGVALPATLPALLPPQSAAMAAYAAAVAAAQHSHHLMMASPSGFSRASPPGVPLSPDDAILDFSKRSHLDDSDSDAVNLSKPGTPPPPEAGNGPLDLSFSSRKRLSSGDDSPLQPPARKARTDYKWPSPIGASHLPYFAAAVAAASNHLSPKSSELWNGKLKSAPNDATKALEKMSELSKLGGDDLYRSMAPSSSSASNRHSAWQSHWLNKGAEQAKDVLKCVWCKQSFPSLAAMTTHMKEAKHCGVNVPVPPMMHPQPPPPPPPQITSPSSTSSTSSSKQPSDLNMLIKETMPLPRKLVRGQDVWLGKGAEQTRQILKCMWCGQSFRSLAEMTSHMQQTQHYTNIISQEQIISWRSTDDPKGGGGGGGASGGGGTGNSQPPGGASSHVSAVLTCKVCDQAFSSLKELSNHMVKNSHYKEHIMRSITESGGRRRQTREKRKKSLPVRKLLELERAQHDFKNGDTAITDKGPPSAAGRITCEKCANKIDTALFVDHIRQCVGGGAIGPNQRNFLKSALMSILPPESPKKKDKSPSPVTEPKEAPPPGDNNNGSAPSVLNAIEKLIEKSFDSRGRQNANFAPANAPMGSSILKRLGIDESVDYTKPLVDAQTMNLLRSYHQQQGGHYGRRERSGSESSSISESRVDSLTPERKMEPPASTPPRSTPDKPPVEVKKEPAEEPDKNHHQHHHLVQVKEERDDDKQEEEEEKRSVGASPCRSPASSDRSATPRSTNGERKAAGGGSLGALSSMFDSLAGNAEQSTAKRGSSHPLAALQKLCDKTETHTNNRAHAATTPTSSAPTSTATTSSGTTPGAILAFSWACNDAVMTSDSIMKCAFCDTPFISKGAYRHHLSKMHFVKDGVMPDAVTVKAEGVPLKGTAGAAGGPGSTGSKSPPVAAGFEESPHSKFLKYTELAKQLSSKYV